MSRNGRENRRNKQEEQNDEEYEYVEQDFMEHIMKGNHIYEDNVKVNHRRNEEIETDEEDCPSVEGLFDKSKHKRLEALNNWILALRQNFLKGSLLEYKETILDAVKKSFKRGEDELMLGCLLLRIACLTLGEDGSQYFMQFYEILKNYITRGTNVEEIAYCIEALGLICFIWGDKEHSLTCCDLFVNMILDHSNNSVIVNSCQIQLCLIYTTFSDEEILNFIEGDPAFEKITNLLITSKDIQTKLDVGESLAFLSSIVKRELEDAYDVNYFASFIDIDNVILNLSNTPKLKKTQNFDTRDILRTVQEGIIPEVTLTIKNQKFVIDTWHQHLQLNAIRSTLTTGYLTHLENNILLSDILRIDVPSDFVTLNKLEKKQLQAKQTMISKQRTFERNKDRGNKTKSITKFLTED